MRYGFDDNNVVEDQKFDELYYQFSRCGEASEYHGNLWPSAMYLALLFCKQPDLIRNKVILELGAGLCLPSLTSLKCGAKHAIVTDKSINHLPDTNQLLLLNQMQGLSLEQRSLKWGNREDALNLLNDLNEPLNLVIGADILFHHSLYDPVFATFYFLAQYQLNSNSMANATTKFILAYQQRGSSDHLSPLLEYWNLKVTKSIPALSLTRNKSTWCTKDQSSTLDAGHLDSIYILFIESKLDAGKLQS